MTKLVLDNSIKKWYQCYQCKWQWMACMENVIKYGKVRVEAMYEMDSKNFA